MLEIITGWTVFVSVIGGLGLPLCARAPIAADERICLGAVTGCLAVYLTAWLIYLADWPPAVFFALPIAAAALSWWRRHDLRNLISDRSVKTLLVSGGLLSGWLLCCLALIRSYSGGEWLGDWVEHFQRAQFFLDRWPLDKKFLGLYLLPARPPLANLVTGAFLALSEKSFAYNQIFLVLLSSLAFFPAALLARRWRKSPKDPAPVLALFLMLSPFVMTNATFAWTKLPAAFFILTGLYFFVSVDAALRPRLIYAFVSLAAAVLTHYSAAPFAIVIGLAWLWRAASNWSAAEFRWATSWAIVAALALAVTWLGWSFLHYGWATLGSNTSVTENAHLTLAEKILRPVRNFYGTVVPHPLRHTDYAFIAQNSPLGWYRDYFFNIYQTNFFFAFGSIGGPILGLLLWQNRGNFARRWVIFFLAILALAAAACSWPDRWGTVSVIHYPWVLIGMAWLAAGWSALPFRARLALGVGWAVDLGLGIILQLRIEHFILPPNVMLRPVAEAMRQHIGWTLWRNAAAKQMEHLDFVGDGNFSALIPITAMTLILLSAVALASRSPAKNPAAA